MSEKTNGLTDEQNAVMMPYFVHEGEMSRMERVNKRWFIAFLIVLVMLFVTNAAWIIYESQFETVTYEQGATYESDVQTSVMNNGTGEVIYNGDKNPSGDYGQGEEGRSSGQSAETMPDM